MYLREIFINGFKSFADRTRLDLGPGVTAVVGPNGCGKSNIVDAIRWVLGEQSAKALRGASMQDVIFEGTETRKALPMSEVSLTFTNCEADLGTSFNEVTISRKVTRDGGSDYFINGKASRLKDIQRLFANTGVGRVSYSFMLQGQIDQILSTNPAERRVIFEEAAGITLYKAQRKEALNKLSLVDANLSRVTDVIEEVSRQIGSLKRQASKALRYRRIHHRVTHLDLALNARRYAELDASIRELQDEEAKVRKRLEEHNRNLEGDETRLREKKKAREELFESIQEQQQRVYNLRSEKENADNQADFSEVRVRDLESRITDYRNEIGDLEKQKAELSRRAESESEKKQMQLNIVDDSDRVFQERNAEVAKTEEELGEKEAALQKQRQSVVHAENRLNRARSRCTTLEVELKSYQVKHSSLAEAIHNAKEEAESLEKDLRNIRDNLTRRSEERKTAESGLEKARERSKTILETYRAKQEEIQQKDREIARKAARLNLLQDLEAKLEGFGEGAKAILGDKLAEIVEKGDVAVVSKFLKAPAEYTEALAILLGSASEAIYLGDPAKARAVIGKLDTEQLGRACLQVGTGRCRSGANPELPEGILRAGKVVEARESRHAEAVARLLDGCYFASDLETFLNFWEENPDFEFLFAGTFNGEVVDCRGLIYGGRSSGKKSASVLERESEIRDLGRDLETERAALESLRAEAAKLEEKRENADEEVEEFRRRLGELANEVSALENEERNQKQKIENNTRGREQNEKELADLDSRHRDSVAELEQAKQELSEAEEALRSEREKADGLEAELAEARKRRDEKREALSDVRLDLAEKKQRLESADRALKGVKRETSQLEERILRRNQEIDTVNEQIEEQKKTGAEERRKSAELEKTLKVASEQLEKDRASLKEMDSGISEIDNGLAGRRSESREMEQKLNKLEVRLAEDRSRLGFLDSGVRDEHQTELSQVDWRKELWEAGTEFEKRVNPDDLDDPDKFAAHPKEERREPTEEECAELEETDWNEVEREVNELKGRLSSMGPVNLDSISEYADLKERYDFLKGQSEDLWNSKNALIQTIDEINETSQTLFRETFEQVRRNFAFTYGKLTGGGESDLKLIDADDPLESGIEIVARPPGIRLKSVTLLSGGQRTMAAVALLFAIYLVKPSPFCVLDEIDAALDDANIGRFCEILEDFTEKSQFLIVTHNKRTIAHADTVFGVTMPEKGVSKLVSMRFHKEGGEPKAVGPETAGTGTPGD